MKQIDNLKCALKEVYIHKIYFAVTISSSFVLFSFNGIFRNFSLLRNSFSFKLLFTLILGTYHSSSLSAFIVLLIISIIGGVVLTFSAYVIKRQISSGLAAGSGSLIVAILAPACPSCALGIFGILGIGGITSFLPFQGLELSLLGLVLMVVALFYLAKKVNTKVCKAKS
tara:strand:- start:550 stop:1059 length:510 start_codon:yes stop_codon:yes gene_type:complete